MCAVNVIPPYHIPALREPVVDFLNVRESGRYADATFGGGGHSRAILERLGPDGHLYGFDRDADAKANAPQDPRFSFVHGDFRYMANFLDYMGALPIDGIIADLGVSFHHFDQAERGFSFRADAPLDMRMNQSAPLTAADLLSTISSTELERLLKLYADLRQPRRVAEAVVKARSQAPLLTTSQLMAAAEPALDPRKVKKEAAQLFQALRIEVNGEIRALERLLTTAAGMLRPGARMVILTYHSVEDRLVKNFFRSGRLDGEVRTDLYGRTESPWKVLTRQPITASEEEVERNPRARSAKLRAAEFTGNSDNKVRNLI